jgi:molybdopterin/thiamine biosynthesis adenylyltransferase
VLAFKKGKAFESVCETDRRQIGQFYQQAQVSKGGKQHHALYIALKDDARLVPPLMGHLWTAQDVRSVIDSNLSPANQSALQRATGQCPDEELVILSLPRPSGGQTLIGLLYQNIRLAHPLHGGQSSAPIPVPILRLDRVQLMPRGGGDSALFEKRVMVAGCGAVGGFAALALARSGIGSVILVDPDILRPENVFRHVLGRSALGKGKATALKTEIEGKYPYVKVDGHQCRVEDLVSSDEHIPNRFDALLLAVGNQGIEMWANRWIHEQGLPFPAVFTWLEPYGIGGHALLTRLGQPGCYQCLIAPASSDTPLANRAAFARYGQIFARDDLGCGSQYVPYGALDAERTANLAVSLLLDALSGREQGNPIISWKGRVDDFAAHGFKVSGRYEMSPDELYAGRYAYMSHGCPVCGSD